MRKSTEYTLTLYNVEQYNRGLRIPKEPPVKSNNLITNGYSTIKDELLQNEITVGAFSGISNSNTSFEPADGGMGGILLLEDTQGENVNNFIPQGAVIGYAGDSVSSIDTRRGQRVDNESGPIGTLPVTGFRDKYVFQSDEANGTINAVAKIPKKGGDGQLMTATSSANVLTDANGNAYTAYSEDKSIFMSIIDGALAKREVPTTDGQFRYEDAIYEDNYVETALTLTGFTSFFGVTFYDGFWYVLAFKTADGNNVILKLDDDFAIQQEFAIDTSGDLLIPSTSNRVSYACGIINGFALFVTDLDTGADTLTFKTFKLSDSSVGTIVVDDFGIAGSLTANNTSYRTFKDPNGNENLMIIFHINADANNNHVVVLDSALVVVESVNPGTFGVFDGVTGISDIIVPFGGHTTLVRLSTEPDNTGSRSEFEHYYSRTMMSNNDLPAPVVKTSSDILEVVVDVNYV